MKFQTLQKTAHYQALMIWRTKAFWARAVLCWMVGTVILVNDEFANFDWRLKIRGPRPAAASIILVDVSERDWTDLDPNTRNILRPLKELISFTDAFFWNPRLWEKLLTNIIDDDPASVGVTFYFGDNIRQPVISQAAKTIFEDPRIVWGTDVDSSDRMLVPVFATAYKSNVGVRTIRADDDGTVRRFSTARGAHLTTQAPHLALKLAEIAQPDSIPWIDHTYQTSALINFAGGDESFKVVSARDVIEGKVSARAFHGKIVIIGSLKNNLAQMQTPLGRMSRAEIIANITDNVVTHSTITRGNTSIYVLLLALLMAGAIWVLLNYPQSIALVVFTLSVILLSAMSVAAFDVLHIWVPVLSPLAQLTVTCIVFLSYQLANNERRTWRLEQEKLYLSEIEQLKTNFVSMMSHDLKTPIAKIQAICDRLLASAIHVEFTQDLKSLRRSSDELHRYIQSILQVTKVEAKDFKIQKEVTDINENIDRVFGRLQPLAFEKGLKLEAQLEPMFSIEADTTLIQEVIHNLIENAIKYTPSDGRVTVTSQEKDDNVIVVVEDTGPGIEPEDLDEIWGKFTRGRNQSMEIKGTGLGLYLVKYFIELHGGQVFMESTLGKGTRVGFSIPVATETVKKSS